MTAVDLFPELSEVLSAFHAPASTPDVLAEAPILSSDALIASFPGLAGSELPARVEVFDARVPSVLPKRRLEVAPPQCVMDCRAPAAHQPFPALKIVPRQR